MANQPLALSLVLRWPRSFLVRLALAEDLIHRCVLTIGFVLFYALRGWILTGADREHGTLLLQYFYPF
jgi:hypothetical protein